MATTLSAIEREFVEARRQLDTELFGCPTAWERIYDALYEGLDGLRLLDKSKRHVLTLADATLAPYPDYAWSTPEEDLAVVMAFTKVITLAYVPVTLYGRSCWAWQWVELEAKKAELHDRVVLLWDSRYTS